MAGKLLVFSFGGIKVREREFAIVKAGEVLPVEPKAFRVLLFLLRNPQKLITKEELLDEVWGDTAVSENSLARSIALLRRLLGDESHNPRYIETVATVGYRWVCKVEVSEDESGRLEATGNAGGAPPDQDGESADGETRSRKPTPQIPMGPGWMWLTIGGILVAGLACTIWFLHRPLPPPRITQFNQITHDGHSKYLIGTDGSRVYFMQLFPQAIAQVGSNGGEVAPVPIASLPGSPDLWDISPDGNTALAATGDKLNLNRTVWSVRILGGAIHRLGEFHDAEFAPDGSIFFTNLEGDIYLMQSNGTGQKKLASPGRGTIEPHLSPDGKVIRFQREEGNSVLYEMLPDGTGIHRLLGDWKVPGDQWGGRWTRDGKFYLFMNRQSFAEGGQIWVLDERRGLFPKLPQPVQLTNGPIKWTELVPGADGKTIFAGGQTRRGELSRFDQKTNEFKPFLGGISAEFVTYSKDGNLVAYVSFPDGVLWKANRDGSNPVQLTDPPIYPSRPRWSPDGTQILFSDGADAKIYTVPSEGGSPRRLLSDDKEVVRDPDWSPDGKKFVFARGDFRDLKNEDLRIVDVASNQVTPIPGSKGLFAPIWSPDGRYIAAMAWEGPQLRIFDVKTQKWRGLPTNGLALFPTFSRDSQYIYFLRSGSDQGIFRIDVNRVNLEKFADMSSFHFTGFWGYSITLDPTDAPIVTRDVGTEDIYALTLEAK